MSTLQVAHINQQGQNMVIVPLDSGFHRKTQAEKDQIISALQACASSAGLAGTVVPVWLYNNSMHFIAPRPWHPFFSSLSWNQILANRNKNLTCSNI